MLDAIIFINNQNSVVTILVDLMHDMV